MTTMTTNLLKVVKKFPDTFEKMEEDLNDVSTKK